LGQEGRRGIGGHFTAARGACTHRVQVGRERGGEGWGWGGVCEKINKKGVAGVADAGDEEPREVTIEPSYWHPI
jgi:hypothetical protein